MTAYVNLFALLFLLSILVYAAHYAVKRLLRIVLIRISKRSDVIFFHHLLNNRFPHYIALSMPLIIIKATIPIIFTDFPDLIRPMNAITDVYMVLVVIWMIMAIIRAGGDHLCMKPAFRENQ